MRRGASSIIISLSALVTISARCQGTYSVNAVGYINQTLYPGVNLVANQLDTADNTLNGLYPAGSVLAGTTFSEWNPTTGQLLPWSIFNGASWSINYTLAPNGIGGELVAPATEFATYVGNVVNVNLNGSPFYTFTPPPYGPGTYLLSVAAPISGATFQQITGLAPVAGDSVETIDPTTQIYTTTTFNGVTWDNGTPSLAIAQSAYFTLVPEPSTLLLAGMGAGILLFGIRRA